MTPLEWQILLRELTERYGHVIEANRQAGTITIQLRSAETK